MPILLTLIPLIALVILLIYVIFGHRINKPEEELHTFTPDLLSEELLRSASAKADSILTQAEGSIKTEFNQKLDEEAKTAAASYEQFLKELQQRSLTSQSQIEELLKNRINSILFNLEQNLSGFLTSSEQKSIEAINLELKSARNLIDTYKNQQLQIIDENIVAVLERTLSLVMRNKLTLKDQMDLVYEALEKAKVEKFFA